ncbi:MAG: alpha/beta fold hydrolase [Candidatus Accumulibacter sp.]|jgi:pimeloyl-[acyl-carrier protein] methyl ester esterase|nr:alpha/beta fold hydrolase [Accumulibacter sp.]
MPLSSIPANVVLIPGWGFTPLVWDSLARSLAQTYEVRCPALPGCAAETSETSETPGVSRASDSSTPGSQPAPVDFEDFARRLALEVPEGALLCGWSLGGMIALQAALDFPRRFSGLVLISASPCFLQKPDWGCAQAPELLESFADATAKDAPGTLQRFNALLNQGDARAREATRTLSRALPPAPDTASLLRGLEWLRRVDLRARVASIEIPVRLIHGDKDPLMPLEAARWMKAQLPNARLEILPGAAHAPFANHPETVARWMLDDSFSSSQGKIDRNEPGIE